MLASLLYPYDDDAIELMGSWLSELEAVDCIVSYEAGGQRYIQITNWTQHQKIDRASPSKFPAPPAGKKEAPSPLPATSKQEEGADSPSFDEPSTRTRD